jgi:hypothetical protein
MSSILETYELLKNRIGWKTPPGNDFVVSAENQITESGMYFQEEHPAVTLRNIHNCIEVENADNDVLNAYLSDFRKQAVTKVVSNVFDGTTIIDISDHLSAFDTAISQRMAIIILELITSTTRTNKSESALKQSNKLFFELNGGSGNPNFPNYVGIRDRYGLEIERLRDSFNTDTALDSFTLRIGGTEDKYRLN